MGICGVYAVEGPAGIYVGQSLDCGRRNEQVAKLGLRWYMVRVMDSSSTSKELRTAETAVADEFEGRGITVVSVNSTQAKSRSALRREAQYQTLAKRNSNGGRVSQRGSSVGGRAGWPKGVPLSMETRAKISATKRGCRFTAEHRARIGQSMRQYFASRQQVTGS